VSKKIAERFEKNGLQQVCFVAQDGSDSKKINKLGCYWKALDGMSLKMSKHFLLSQCWLAGILFYSFV